MLRSAIVLVLVVGMAIGAALLGYPAWAIPLIAIFGGGDAIAAIRVLVGEVSEKVHRGNRFPCASIERRTN